MARVRGLVRACLVVGALLDGVLSRLLMGSIGEVLRLHLRILLGLARVSLKLSLRVTSVSTGRYGMAVLIRPWVARVDLVHRHFILQHTGLIRH